eukprot:1850497-Pleurochrysis_carterae.AAC.2
MRRPRVICIIFYVLSRAWNPLPARVIHPFLAAMPFMDDAGYPWRSRSLNDEYQLLSDGYGAENTTRQNIVGGILARSIALSLGLVLFSARRPLGRFASNVAHNTYIALQRLALRPGALRIRDLDAPLSPATGANHAPSKWFPRTLRRLFSKSHTAELAHGIDCSCYYTDNMFVNSPVRAHFSFVSDAQFESSYPDLLSSLTHQQRGELYDQLHAEAARRKGAAQAAEARKRLIAREYKPRWPSLWTLSIEHLNPDFVDMVKGGTVPEKLGQGDVYSIPVFRFDTAETAHARTHAVTHAPTHARKHAPMHPRTHAATRPRAHSPTHPRTHALAHPLGCTLRHASTHARACTDYHSHEKNRVRRDFVSPPFKWLSYDSHVQKYILASIHSLIYVCS